jgi:hypothetical protein
MKLFSILFLVFLSNGWTFCQTQNRPFELVKDILHFSELMTEKDTLVINTDLWICETERYERDLITKRGDSVFIHVKGIEDRKNFEYGTRVYEPQKYDTCNFETLFLKLKNRTNNRDCNSKTIEIIHNNRDTLIIWTGGLMEKLFVSNYIWKIKDKIYFDKDYYKPMPIPPKPTGLSDEEKLDSIMNDNIKKELEKIENDKK